MSREIGIDAGHRVPTHGSKCKNIHGHRYKIIAHCSSENLVIEGEQAGMVLDFGFLKEEMTFIIDKYCDHALILWADDELLPIFLVPEALDRCKDWLERVGYFSAFGDSTIAGKLYVIPFIPTAEYLAKHWFSRLAPKVNERSNGIAKLERIDVWETPNCVGSYISE